MNRFALAGACLLVSAVSAHAQYVDGLPAAASVSSADLLPVIQGSTPVVGGGFLPGSGVARRATVGQIAGAVGGQYIPYSGASSPVNLGGFPLTLGVASAPSAPGSGGALYVDGAGVLHLLTATQDFPLGGASYNGSTTQHWWIGGYGFGQPVGTGDSTDLPNLFINRTVSSSGGSGVHGPLKITDAVLGNGLIFSTLAAAAAGQPVIVIKDNSAVVVAGQPVSGPGIPAGATVASVQHGVPVSGQATVTLSANTTAAIYSGSPIAVGQSTAAEAEIAISPVCNTLSGVPGANCIGGLFGGNKYVAGPNAVWGINPSAGDLTGRKSSASGAVTSVEASVTASGPDDGVGVSGTSVSGVRSGVEVVATSGGVSGDGATSFLAGVLARTNVAPGFWDPVTLKYGFYASTMHPVPDGGQITTAFGADGGNVSGLGLFSGTYTEAPSASATSGSTSLSFGYVGIADNAYVSDAHACIPAGTRVSPGGTTADAVAQTVTITLTNPTTCTVDGADTVTFANSYTWGVNLAGYYSNALMHAMNSAGAGLVQFGGMQSSGTTAKLSFMGTDSAGSVVSYADITGSVVSNTPGSTSGLLTVTAPLRLAQTTVAALPTCNAALKGGLMGVTDATSPTYNGALTGGGSVAVPVYCNGSAWTSH